MEHCPVEYQTTCQNYCLLCRSCCAGYGSLDKKLQYKPVVGMDQLKPHPYQEVKDQHEKDKRIKPSVDKKKSKQTKEGRKAERKVIKNINQSAGIKAKSTVASGAHYGDGDFTINDQYKVEHKKRISSKSFTVTKAEYEKGKQQNIDLFMITNEDQETMVFMPLALFKTLLGNHADLNS